MKPNENNRSWTDRKRLKHRKRLEKIATAFIASHYPVFRSLDGKRLAGALVIESIDQAVEDAIMVAEGLIRAIDQRTQVVAKSKCQEKSTDPEDEELNSPV